MSKRVLVCLLGSWFLASAAFAQEDLPTLLQRSDGNGDGRLQRDEAPVDVLTHFSEIDTDGDGSIDSFEAEQFERRKRRQQMRKTTRPGASSPKRPDSAGRGQRTMVGVLKARDQNADGKLDLSELPAQVHERFPKFDRNGDGFVDLDEARAIDAARERAETAESSPARRSFARTLRLMDTNGDGLLQKKEAPLRVQRQFDQIDKNADGALDEAEALAADAATR